MSDTTQQQRDRDDKEVLGTIREIQQSVSEMRIKTLPKIDMHQQLQDSRLEQHGHILSRMEGTASHMDRRLSMLERFMWMLLGGLAILTVIVVPVAIDMVGS